MGAQQHACEPELRQALQLTDAAVAELQQQLRECAMEDGCVQGLGVLGSRTGRRARDLAQRLVLLRHRTQQALVSFHHSAANAPDHLAGCGTKRHLAALQAAVQRAVASLPPAALILTCPDLAVTQRQQRLAAALQEELRQLAPSGQHIGANTTNISSGSKDSTTTMTSSITGGRQPDSQALCSQLTPHQAGVLHQVRCSSHSKPTPPCMDCDQACSASYAVAGITAKLNHLYAAAQPNHMHRSHVSKDSNRAQPWSSDRSTQAWAVGGGG
ncbi:hypothetical protein HaLaN_17481 [Haematococcus lacustris]|uniref:Uncharacterized protein n=1 Tax=Haematococcus lacustris TaxID=44745 RepID=A0A699ZWR0_HAELA|nr:hypothetical protein HaLaN_17481 [Haematococcus lacustris]